MSTPINPISINVNRNVNQLAQRDIHNSGGQSFNNRELNYDYPDSGPTSRPSQAAQEAEKPIDLEAQDLIKKVSELIMKETIEGDELVLIVGPTGVGKSITLNYLLGKKIEVIEDDTSVDILYDVDEETDIVVGHESGLDSSKTLFPNIKKIENIWYADCPGFLDNRGLHFKIANAINVSKLIHCFNKIKCPHRGHIIPRPLGEGKI
ncbi:MAG: hypothetical protein KDK56_10760 [Simkania sp.]|nr:hypothetical protein [Simkania sp.]